jgi:hypothetical protein
MWRMSGPAARRGTFLMRHTWPPGNTASHPTTMSSMPPYSVENWPMLRVATRPPMLAIGFDWGEWPVVSPSSRAASSRRCSGTPHSTVACMSYASISMIRSICEPSTTIEFSAPLSRPPSVAVPPVRATTLTRCSSANASTLATSAVLRAITIAAGTVIVCTSKMFWSLRKLSTLDRFSSASSVITCSAESMVRSWSTIWSRVRVMAGPSGCGARWRWAQWKIG